MAGFQNWQNNIKPQIQEATIKPNKLVRRKTGGKLERKLKIYKKKEKYTSTVVK